MLVGYGYLDKARRRGGATHDEAPRHYKAEISQTSFPVPNLPFSCKILDQPSYKHSYQRLPKRKMSIIQGAVELRNSIHALLETGREKDEAVFAKILEELKAAGGEFAKDAALIVEIVKQKVSGAPMDDRTMMVSYTLHILYTDSRQKLPRG